MSVCDNLVRLTVLCAVAAAVASGGCMSQPVAPPPEAPRVVIVADGGEAIKAAELDELTRAFADRFVGMMYSACDEVRKDNVDPAQRREAQVFLADSASNIYDIATNADAFTRLLDLVVVTRLMNQVWVEDGRAKDVFGDRAPNFAKALLYARTEIEALQARVLTTEQVAAVETLLADWHKEHPEMVQTSFVRFSNFAVGRGKSAASEVLAASGLFSEVGKAGQAVDEARLLGERVFYQFKREPTLLRWQIAAAKDDILTSPELTAALADVHRVTEVVEKLPGHIATERAAIVAAVDARLARADATVEKVNKVVTEARLLAAELGPTSKSIDQMVKSADVLFNRYDTWNRWAAAKDPRLFQITEYTDLVREGAVTSDRLNDLVKSSGSLLGSPDWQARINELNRSADGRIEIAAGKSRELMNDLFRRVYFAIGLLFVVLICYRVISIVLARRLLPKST